MSTQVSHSELLYRITVMMKFLSFKGNDVFIISDFKLHNNIVFICCNIYGAFSSKIANTPEGVLNKIFPTPQLVLHTYEKIQERCISKLRLQRKYRKITNIDLLIKKIYNIGFIEYARK